MDGYVTRLIYMNDLTHCGTIEIATERLYLKRIEKYDATSMYSNFIIF